MAVATFDSREARAQRRNLLDTAAAGESDIVITRYGKPVAALIDYEYYLALQEELDELRAIRRADRAYAEYLRDPSSARPYSEIRAQLVAEGVLMRKYEIVFARGIEKVYRRLPESRSAGWTGQFWPLPTTLGRQAARSWQGWRTIGGFG